MKMLDNRFDPSSLTKRQLRELDGLSEAILADERPALIGRKGERLVLPDPIFNMLSQVVRSMREGQAIVLLPENQRMTTQAAAEFLGVSRPFVVDLLEKNVIPHHKVGTHRRVYLKDLMEYQHQRDARRRTALDDLRNKVEEAGLYEKRIGVGDER